MRSGSGHLIFFLLLLFYITFIQTIGPSREFDNFFVSLVGVICCLSIVRNKNNFHNSYIYSLTTLTLFGTLFFYPESFLILNISLAWWVALTIKKITRFNEGVFSYWPYFCFAVALIGFISYKNNDYTIYTFPLNWHNQSCIFLATSIPFYLLKIFKSKKNIETIRDSIFLLFIFYCIYLTDSKAGIALSFISLFSLPWVLEKCVSKDMKKIFFLSVPVLVILVFRFTDFFQNLIQDFSFRSRLAYFSASFEMGKSNPFSGVGWGQFKYHYPSFQTDIEYATNDPHSWIFRAWAEGGFLGLILVFLLLSSFFKVFGNKKMQPKNKCFIVASAMILIHGLVDFHATFIPIPLMLGFFWGSSSENNERKASIFEKKKIIKFLPISAGFVFCVLSLGRYMSPSECAQEEFSHQCIDRYFERGFGSLDSSEDIQKIFKFSNNLTFSHVRRIVENRSYFPKNISVRQSLLALQYPQNTFITKSERLTIAQELNSIDPMNRPEVVLMLVNEMWPPVGELEKREIMNIIDNILETWPNFKDKEEIFSFKLDARKRGLNVIFSKLWEIKSILSEEETEREAALEKSKNFLN